MPEPSNRSPARARPGPPPSGPTGEDEYVEVELAITARQIELGFFRGLDGKALSVKEAQERMERSERYLRWRYQGDHQ